MAVTDIHPSAVATTPIPDQFNVATYFVDRNVAEGRGDNVAIETYPGHAQITYRQVLERVNRVGNALRDVLGVGIEQRVLLLLLDCPEFVYSFFAAIKIGAVPIPTNTLWKAADYEYLLNDSNARVLIISAELVSEFERIPRRELRALHHVVFVVATGLLDAVDSLRLLADASPH